MTIMGSILHIQQSSLPTILPSVVSVTNGQPWSKNTLKIPDINNSQCLNYVPSKWHNKILYHPALSSLGHKSIPLSTISTLYICHLPINHLAAIRSIVTVSQCLCSSNPYFIEEWPQRAKAVMLAIWICQRDASFK